MVFQPIKFSGRKDASLEYSAHSPSIGEVVEKIDCCGGKVKSVHFDRDPWASEFIAQAYFDKISLSQIDYRSILPAESIKQVFYLDRLLLNYGMKDIFRVSVVNFMDINTFSHDQLARSPVGFATESGICVPLDSYYLHL